PQVGFSGSGDLQEKSELRRIPPFGGSAPRQQGCEVVFFGRMTSIPLVRPRTDVLEFSIRLASCPMDKTSVAPAGPGYPGGLVSGVAAAILAVIIVATLYFGRELFVPIALAILLSFVLAPLVRALQRLHVPRALSVVGVVLLAFLVIF